ncbi:hypothetical protein Tco_0698989 [Tanacetum coccineum]
MLVLSNVASVTDYGSDGVPPTGIVITALVFFAILGMQIVAEFCSLMEREGYTIEGDYLHVKHVIVSSNDVKAFVAGTNNVASLSSSTHNIWINAEGGGSSVPSPSSPITDAINSLIHTSDASHSENVMALGNVVGTGQNIDGSNSMVGGQGSGNVRRGAPRAGRIGASPLAILNPNPMEMNQGSTNNTTSIQDIKPRTAERKPSD